MKITDISFFIAIISNIFVMDFDFSISTINLFKNVNTYEPKKNFEDEIVKEKFNPNVEFNKIMKKAIHEVKRHDLYYLKAKRNRREKLTFNHVLNWNLKDRVHSFNLIDEKKINFTLKHKYLKRKKLLQTDSEENLIKKIKNIKNREEEFGLKENNNTLKKNLFISSDKNELMLKITCNERNNC